VSRLIDDFFSPFIEALSCHGRLANGRRVNPWIDPKHQSSAGGLFGFLSQLFTGLDVIINGFMKGGFEFVDGARMENDGVFNIGYS